MNDSLDNEINLTVNAVNMLNVNTLYIVACDSTNKLQVLPGLNREQSLFHNNVYRLISPIKLA